MNINLEGIAVPQAAGNVVFDVPVEGFGIMGLSIINSSLVALDDLHFEAKFSEFGQAITVAGAALDYTTPVFPVKKASGNLNVLAGGGVAFIIIDVSAFWSLAIVASSSGPAGSTLAVHGQVN